ncbi:MAG: GNAT family N-acetyltransferase [Clostridia bacterium]|nr:GNAT family N-acetyltransferase [Clostridia bacterium]
MQLRPFAPADAAETAQLIATTLRITNSRDYSAEYIEDTIASHDEKVLLDRAAWSHMYVAVRAGQIIGCGAISSFWGGATESILLTIFVLPEYQGQGVGRRIVETLEADEYFLRANRIEISASITAVPFYQRMGYSYKNGVTTPDEEGCIRLEKHR